MNCRPCAPWSTRRRRNGHRSSDRRMKAPWYRANASTFPCRGLEDLLEAAQQGSEGHRISSHPTGSPEHVAVPPLAMGSQILAHIPICETPPVARWNEDGYESAIPWVCEVQDAL